MFQPGHVTHHAAPTVIRRMLSILAHIVCRHMQPKRNTAVCELAHTSDFILPAHGSLVRYNNLHKILPTKNVGSIIIY